MNRPTPAQIETWESYKQVAQRTDLEISITKWQAQNCALAVEFAHRKGLAQNVDITSLIEQVKNIEKRGEKLKQAIGGVELQDLGLRFRDGDIDFMAPSGTNSDVIAHYQLGWILIAAGIVVGAGAIAYMYLLREQNSEVNGKLTALTDDMDALLCADPSSALCEEWKEIKTLNRYHERENLIDTTKAVAAGLPDAVKKATSWGLSVGIPLALVAMVVLWRDK